eukprot:2856562-Amphidinium_carterae.1
MPLLLVHGWLTSAHATNQARTSDSCTWQLSVASVPSSSYLPGSHTPRSPKGDRRSMSPHSRNLVLRSAAHCIHNAGMAMRRRLSAPLLEATAMPARAPTVH